LLLLSSVTFPSHAFGKAEPLPIEFKGGSSSAIFKGTVRGDEQHEYQVAAKKGQWLMIEVTSQPLDAAVFAINKPQGEETVPHYAWSGSVEETGDYQIDVRKPADYKIARFMLTVTLASRPPAPLPIAKDASSVSLQAAMRKFINACRKKDRAAFLSLFSRVRPVSLLNPQNIGSKSHFRTVVTYSALASDINRKRGFYWEYLERGNNGDADAFVDHIGDSKMWARVKGKKFVSPGADITSSTYVRWRRESGRWVVDEISYPQA
jgi:hypothetical protein